MSGISKIGSAVRAALLGSSSTRAVQSGSPVEFKTADDYSISKKRGKRIQFGRNFIRYERTGPFHRQIGERTIAGSILPVMETFFMHHILHATKGWRKYIGGAAMRLPQCPNGKSYPAAFFGRNHKFA